MNDFILPDIGEGIVECELVKWLIKEGDVIEEDQAVAEVMTDKALVEIPAPHAGTVVRLYCREGEIARVHAPLFAVDEAGESDGNGGTGEAGGADGQVAPAGDHAPSGAKAPGADSGDEAAGESVSERRSRDFILPDIGEGIVECEVVTWHVAEGDKVEEDQTIVDVMTDKALVEITASEPGRIVRFHYAQGENARVHPPCTLMCLTAMTRPTRHLAWRTRQSRRQGWRRLQHSTLRLPVPQACPRPRRAFLPRRRFVVCCASMRWTSAPLRALVATAGY
ncbi:biotin/lipoyl-containing protein [Cobetia marina]